MKKKEGKIVMKKIALVLAILCTMLLALSACSSKCKVDGCDEKKYKDGYCELHYELKELGNLFS